MESTKDKSVHILALIAALVLGGSIALNVYRTKQGGSVENQTREQMIETFTEVTEELTEDVQKAEQCKNNLIAIADAVDEYRQGNSGRYPPSLEFVVKDNNLLICPSDDSLEDSYIYAGAGLNADSPPETVLAYDSVPRHGGSRHVLSAGKVKQYFIDDKKVTREYYEEQFRILSDTYDPEQRMIADDTFMLVDRQTGLLSTKAYTEQTRVLTLTEDELKETLDRNNRLDK